MKKTFIAISLFSAVFMNTVSAQQPVNDVNTPLHLMKPNYETPYNIPSEDGVKATIDRVLTYLEAEMPTEVKDGKIKTGGLRLTSYEVGVLYNACIDAALRTGDLRYRKFATDRLNLVSGLAAKIMTARQDEKSVDPQMRKVCFPMALDDAGAMCSAYIRMLLTDPKLVKKGQPVDYTQIDDNTRDVINRYIDHIANKQYRLPDGTLARIRPHYNTVWLDDMYMGIPALVFYGKISGKKMYYDETLMQMRAFKVKMWEEKEKLFRHGWVEEMDPHPFFPWGRANGWALLTMCEVLDQLPADFDDREIVLDLFRKHVEGLCAVQDKTGFWHQLLNRPDSYLETSATAIYAYCMAHAICEGWIDAEAYGSQTLLAWNAVATKVNGKGQVEGTCVGSGMGFDPAFYCYRPVHVMAAHGYGPVVWAGGEIIRMLKQTHPKMNDSAIQFYPTEQKTDEPIFSEKREGVEDEKVLW